MVVNLLELILAKKIMIQIMKLVEYKHSLVSLKTENLKKLEKESSKRIKELENEIKKTKTVFQKNTTHNYKAWKTQNQE